MSDAAGVICHWGYLAIFLFVVLGNMGVPLPEEAVLALSGYLVWQGQLRLPVVLAVGIVSATAGDSLGYWLGWRFGRIAIERYGQWVLGRPTRIERLERFVTRYGPQGVFVARFVPGLRFMAGPLAGALNLRFSRFWVANLFGAATYVPVMVGVGYAVGLGFGQYVERLRHLIGSLERTVLLVALCLSAAVLTWRVFHVLFTRRAAPADPEGPDLHGSTTPRPE
jgi:membrane protein DedA with SNARE-associated domain